MRTDDLIAALVADGAAPRPSLAGRLAAALAIGFAASAVLFLLALGPRDDIAAAMATPRFVLKPIEALLLVATAAWAALRLARPGAETSAAAVALAAAPVLLALAVGAELLLTSPAEWPARLVGSNARICLTAIPLMALPPLAAALIALRHGAPTRPGLAGAVAGLAAGGLAAALYATHCTDDSPLFVATWYSLAIALVAALGAAAGRRVLAW